MPQGGRSQRRETNLGGHFCRVLVIRNSRKVTEVFQADVSDCDSVERRYVLNASTHTGSAAVTCTRANGEVVFKHDRRGTQRQTDGRFAAPPPHSYGNSRVDIVTKLLLVHVARVAHVEMRNAMSEANLIDLA